MSASSASIPATTFTSRAPPASTSRAPKLLCHVDTEDEALETIAALTQLYREQGHYLERIYKWAKRVGLESIRANIVDDAANAAPYFERFVFAQSFLQIDPWAERVAGTRCP